MKKIGLRFIPFSIALSRFSWRLLVSFLVLLNIGFPLNVQAQSANRVFTSAEGTSKATIEPGGFGAVTVVPITPTVIPLGLNRYGGPAAYNAGTKQMSANRIVLPPGARGPRNLHKGADSILMIIQGNLTSLLGAEGEKALIHKPGDFLYVPGDVWHQWVNPSKTESVTFVEIRADADDYTNVQIIPTP